MVEKRIMHYRSNHKILLVGEGDFSFSLCLAKAFGTGVNMVATSLDSRVSLGQKYSHALSNVAELEVLGCTILYKVDVHTMTDDLCLQYKKFDRIIFNFPHAGFIYDDEREPMQIWHNKRLVSGFLGNAKQMLNLNGEIHITHKTTYPFTDLGYQGASKSKICLLLESRDFVNGFIQVILTNEDLALNATEVSYLRE